MLRYEEVLGMVKNLPNLAKVVSRNKLLRAAKGISAALAYAVS